MLLLLLVLLLFGCLLGCVVFVDGLCMVFCLFFLVAIVDCRFTFLLLYVVLVVGMM